MGFSSYAAVGATFLCAAGLSFVAAGFSVTLIEESSKSGVSYALEDAGLGWADAESDGLQVFLFGIAPSEADRFKALSVAGSVVDAARLIDQMEVADREAFAPPKFSIEILRNDAGISLIGLVPDGDTATQMKTKIAKLASGQSVSDLLESAQYPAPEGWSSAVSLAVNALSELPRSKISVSAGAVSVTALADSAEQKRALENDLRASKMDGVQLSLDISAPRPVISPFTLRFE